jgi:hypothetical protein
MKKNKKYCSCEETRDDFGGCVPKDESMKECIACGKKITKLTLEKYKKRILRESGWEEEFESNINLAESEEGAVYPYLSQDCDFEYIMKYLEVILNSSPMKVNIKVRKGCIQIERID